MMIVVNVGGDNNDDDGDAVDGGNVLLLETSNKDTKMIDTLSFVRSFVYDRIGIT